MQARGFYYLCKKNEAMEIITINEFIHQQEKSFPFSKGDLSSLLYDIVIAAKIVHREVNRAGLADILGEMGKTNVQGEDQKKLDVIANDLFIRALRAGEKCAGVASEELDDYVSFGKKGAANAHYVVCMDPLDGSSNIDVNVSIGTIFSIFRTKGENRSAELEDFLQKGNDLVAAGYVLYGSSTMLVYTTGNGVNGFTLDPSIGEFLLSHPNLTIPSKGAIYSVNEGNFDSMSEGVKAYINYCKSASNDSGKPYGARYIGSLVADFHRNLLKGGIYFYPGTVKDPKGKLRLLYEAAPLAFICEQAGGMASNGIQNIMDIQPDELHQRCPLFIGNKEMVRKVQEMIALHG